MKHSNNKEEDSDEEYEPEEEPEDEDEEEEEEIEEICLNKKKRKVVYNNIKPSLYTTFLVLRGRRLIDEYNDNSHKRTNSNYI